MLGCGTSVDQLEQLASSAEAEIGRLRGVQIQAIRNADRQQVAMADGARTLVDWVAARFDLTHDTARSLVLCARHMPDHTMADLVSGEITFERAEVETRLHREGSPSRDIEASRGFDLAGIRRMVARRRRMTRRHEREMFGSQHVVIQPNLDESAWRLWGELAGFEGRVVEKALQQRGDELVTAEEGHLATGMRSALALVSVCQDSLEPGPTVGSEPIVTVMVDACTASAGAAADNPADQDGIAGAAIVGGPPIGPAMLEELLCTGRVEVNVTAADGAVLGVGPSTTAIPPRLRRHVLARDGACTIDGCSSRYRLEVHHLTPRSQGGDHHPTNLATLCWFHHHVAVHGRGHTIDPDSPPHRRRLIPPHPPPD